MGDLDVGRSTVGPRVSLLAVAVARLIGRRWGLRWRRLCRPAWSLYNSSVCAGSDVHFHSVNRRRPTAGHTGRVGDDLDLLRAREAAASIRGGVGLLLRAVLPPAGPHQLRIRARATARVGRLPSPTRARAVLTWQAAISHGVYARHLQGNAASTDAPSFAGAFCGAVRLGVEIAARLGASSRL